MKTAILPALAAAALLAAPVLADAAAPAFVATKTAGNEALRAGANALAKGKLELAASLSRQALNKGLSPSRKAAAYANLCAAEAQLGAEALPPACDEAIALEPDFAAGYINRGAARLLLGDAAGAQADLAEAVKLDPKSEEAAGNLKLAEAALGGARQASR